MAADLLRIVLLFYRFCLVLVHYTRSFYVVQLANEVRNPILVTISLFDNVLSRNWLVEIWIYYMDRSASRQWRSLMRVDTGVTSFCR